MKKGLTMARLADELDFRHENKRDFIISTKDLIMGQDAGNNMLTLKDKSNRKPRKFLMELTQYMLGQIAAYIKIPRAVIDRMLSGTADERNSISKAITARLQAEDGTRMVRTLVNRDTKMQYARAFLSDSYRPLDNWEVLQAIFPVLAKLKGQIEIRSCGLTEERMYLKISYPTIQGSLGTLIREGGVKIQDVVEAGVIISNSEVGAGTLQVRPFLLRLSCMNGATTMSPTGNTIRKIHKGVRLLADTINDPRPTDNAFFEMIGEVVLTTLMDAKYFKAMIAQFKSHKQNFITDDRDKLKSVLRKRYGLSEQEAANTLICLGDSKTMFELINAITLMSQGRDVTYERASELEELGGRLIEMDWAAFEISGLAYDLLEI